MFTDRFEEQPDAGVAVAILAKDHRQNIAIRTYNPSIDSATGFRKFDSNIRTRR